MLEDISGSQILIVDDNKDNIHILLEALKNCYKLGVATNGKRAVEFANKFQPDLILLDIMMPCMDGYEVCSALKKNKQTQDIPIIFITAMNAVHNKTKGFELGAVDYITKPFELVEVKARVNTHLTLKKSKEMLLNQNLILEKKVTERTKDLTEKAQELTQTQLEIIFSLGRATEFRDHETGLHIKRMSHYSKILAQAIGMKEDECELLFHASAMHDIGKIGVSDSILLKPGKLNTNEYRRMKKHTTIGAKILSGNNSKLIRLAQIIALTHHEKWDGSGYPCGLKKENIPLAGQICGMCDVFDALTSIRPYKKAWPVKVAIAEIERLSGRHFDPYLVHTFKQVLGKLLSVKQQLSEN